MGTLKNLKFKAVVTKMENGRIYYDVNGEFEASDKIEDLNFIPLIGEEMVYTVQLETFFAGDKERNK